MGMHVAQIAVSDECTESPQTSLVGVALNVVPTETKVLFTENFDSDPFAAGRWEIFMGDCTNTAAGTVAHYAPPRGYCCTLWPPPEGTVAHYDPSRGYCCTL